MGLERWARRRVRADRRGTAEARERARVLAQIQKEAAAAGATLQNDGKGGIDPTIALKLFREAKWRCPNEDCPDPKKEITLDHASGHPKEILADARARKDPKLRAAAKMPDPKDDDGLRVICAACHDRVHERERAIDAGKKPRPMPGA
jgi:hypothetical protein